MPVFPSREWMVAFCVQLEGHPDLGDVARTLDGVYRFVVEPAGPITQRHAYDVAITPGDDVAPPSAQVVEEAGQPRLTLTADYERWRQLIRGDLDVAMAVMLRRLRISGDLSRLLSRLDSTTPLQQSLAGVDTQWPQ